MSERLSLVYAGVDYWDRTAALFDGRVRPIGVDLTCVGVAEAGDLFKRLAHEAPYAAAEMSLASTVRLLAEGRARFVGLPVFPSKAFRHGQVFVRPGAGIWTPADLEGKRIGLVEYEMTSAVWIRGMLSDEYAFDPRRCTWFAGGWSAPATTFRSSEAPPGIDLTRLEPPQTLQSRLEQGDLDVILGPVGAETSPKEAMMERLFPNYEQMEQSYLERTGVFPIMHLVVLRRDVYERHPWTALALTEAFSLAKAAGWRRLLDEDTPPIMHPWIGREAAATHDLFGGDPFAYGVEANRLSLETLLRYCHEQGLTRSLVSIDELFPPEVLDWSEAKAVQA